MSSNLNKTNLQSERFWELDFIRGVAIFFMVIFHWVYQLYFVFNVINIKRSFFYYFPKFAAIFFILLGCSLYIGIERNFYKNFTDVLKRSLFIFSCGVLLTLATLWAWDDFKGLHPHSYGYYIYFGVLHCHGVSTLLSYSFTKLNKWFVLCSAIVLIASNYFLPCETSSLSYIFFASYLPYHLGVTFDYFPLIPNLGYALLGVFLGKQFYTNGNRQFSICTPTGNSKMITNFFDIIGKKTLLIYLVHIPIIFVINILVLFFVKPECCTNIIESIKHIFLK